MANYSKVTERLIRILSDDIIILMADKVQNSDYCPEENPQQIHQRLLHSARVTES
jgi:hypothetical protein